MSHNITVESGTSVRLKTAGKYCDRDIVVTSTGGGDARTPVEEKDVNFYDYDGTCLYSYTIDEVQALTELPDLPSHDGLICQEWNWTLSKMQECNTSIDVGALYITDNGATRLYIDVYGEETSVDLHFSQNVANGVSVDWGDGNVETVAGTGNIDIVHNYPVGKYVISLMPSDNCTLTLGGSNSRVVIGGTATGKTYPLCKVELGKNVSFGTYAFNCCFNLETITVPTGQNLSSYTFTQCPKIKHVNFAGTGAYGDGVGSAMFQYSTGLKTVSISEKVNQMASGGFTNCRTLKRVCCSLYPAGNTNLFNTCYCLKEFVFAPTATTIGTNQFYDCRSLLSLDIPSGVNTINASAFANCYNMKRIRFNSTTPPTVANANAFTNLPTTCVIEVPQGTLETYKTATNYASIAAQMVEVSGV